MNPVLTFDGANGLFSPYKFSEDCCIRDKPLLIRFTKRAKEKLDKMKGKLTVEMQIYFSCMVQKRVLFHENYNDESVKVNDKLAIALRVVQSDVCDPVYYANYHPEKAELTNDKAGKMTAKELIFDYKKEGWIGGFKIG